MKKNFLKYLGLFIGIILILTLIIFLAIKNKSEFKKIPKNQYECNNEEIIVNNRGATMRVCDYEFLIEFYGYPPEAIMEMSQDLINSRSNRNKERIFPLTK